MPVPTFPHRPGHLIASLSLATAVLLAGCSNAPISAPVEDRKSVV